LLWAIAGGETECDIIRSTCHLNTQTAGFCSRTIDGNRRNKSHGETIIQVPGLNNTVWLAKGNVKESNKKDYDETLVCHEGGVRSCFS